MPALHELTAAELAASYKGGKLSPVDVNAAMVVKCGRLSADSAPRV